MAMILFHYHVAVIHSFIYLFIHSFTHHFIYSIAYVKCEGKEEEYTKSTYVCTSTG